jgi:hypothetical protein
MPDNNIEWGQAAVNNSNDFGKAKANSTNNFGAVYDSSPSGDTNIAGGSPVVSITYSASAFCADASDPTPTIQNNAGAGTFSSTTGLVFISTSTGEVDIDASTVGSYLITYTDTDAATATFNLTINALPTVTVSVSAGTICDGESTILTASGASTYVWNDGNTDNPRTVSPTTTTTFTATGTDSNGCTNTGATTITVNAQDSAAFSYAASTYCANGTDPTPTITGTSGGAFTSTTGLVINSGTGVIDLDASTVGAYSITYTTTGVCPANQSVNLTINATDNAAFSYSASSYAPTDSDPTPTITGLTGGTFSGTTGLVIDSSTGVIDLSASTVAAHTITYNTSSSGSSVCPNTSTQNVDIALAGIANNYSMNFDSASSDYISASASNLPTSDYTFSAWVKISSFGGDYGILGYGDYSTLRGSNAFRFESSPGQPNLPIQLKNYWYGDDFNHNLSDTEKAAILNNWSHVLVTYDSSIGTYGQRVMYLNGNQIATNSPTGAAAFNLQNFTIGKTRTNEYFDGKIDEVAVWNTALTSTQVSEIYNAKGTNLTKDLTTVSGSNLKYWNRMGD